MTHGGGGWPLALYMLLLLVSAQVSCAPVGPVRASHTKLVARHVISVDPQLLSELFETPRDDNLRNAMEGAVAKVATGRLGVQVSVTIVAGGHSRDKMKRRLQNGATLSINYAVLCGEPAFLLRNGIHTLLVRHAPYMFDVSGSERCACIIGNAWVGAACASVEESMANMAPGTGTPGDEALSFAQAIIGAINLAAQNVGLPPPVLSNPMEVAAILTTPVVVAIDMPGPWLGEDPDTGSG